jgi:hypothetical protein
MIPNLPGICLKHEASPEVLSDQALFLGLRTAGPRILKVVPRLLAGPVVPANLWAKQFCNRWRDTASMNCVLPTKSFIHCRGVSQKLRAAQTTGAVLPGPGNSDRCWLQATVAHSGQLDRLRQHAARVRTCKGSKSIVLI